MSFSRAVPRYIIPPLELIVLFPLRSFPLPGADLAVKLLTISDADHLNIVTSGHDAWNKVEILCCVMHACVRESGMQMHAECFCRKLPSPRLSPPHAGLSLHFYRSSLFLLALSPSSPVRASGFGCCHSTHAVFDFPGFIRNVGNASRTMTGRSIFGGFASPP